MNIKNLSITVYSSVCTVERIRINLIIPEDIPEVGVKTKVPKGCKTARSNEWTWYGCLDSGVSGGSGSTPWI